MDWPQLSTELREIVLKCDMCITPTRSKPGATGTSPVCKPEISVDLCEFHGRMLVVVSDYYSNYIEVGSLNKTTSGEVMKC